ncbi:DUF4181 domain-containing protein [Cytobacillus sp. FJAT-54145]|uniref:DUF4181 domain-containing protein n=1 Tax=Cytobacillus spartinae TaxID=3299023 RepID=A0ABW6K6F6_9BACI
MNLTNLFIFIIILSLAVIISEKIVRKRFGIKKNKGASRYVNEIHKWGEIILSIGMTIGSLMLVEYNPEAAALFFICYIMVYFGFVWLMQWWYTKESREHIITFVTGTVLILGILITASIPNFIFN